MSISRQSNPPPSKRTKPVRTEQPASCVQNAHITSAVRTGERPTVDPADTIPRTERAASIAVRPPGPLDLDGTARVLTAGTARVLTAGLLDNAMKRHESVVRRWRTGEKSIPLAEELARGILKARGVDLRQAMTTLAQAVDAIESPVAADDRDEVTAQLRDARDRIIARLDRLATDGK